MAFVLGLAPGRATEVPIVVVAEDGVTSLRYFLSIFRAPGRRNSSRQAASGPEVFKPIVPPLRWTSAGMLDCGGSNDCSDVKATACIHED